MRPAWFLALALLAATPAGAAEEPAGYRQDEYRAPVPASLRGAQVIDAAEAHDLWQSGQAVFVDVLPHPPKPDLPEGTIWHEKPHVSIPGAIWLANVGYGTLAPLMDDYFRAGLALATEGYLARPVVFFCLPECWMSWNAAKRAVEEYGYSRVLWFPEGADGWAAAGYPTAVLEPVPGGG